MSKTLHPLIHRLGRRHTQKGEIHGDRETRRHTHAHPKLWDTELTESLRNSETHNGDTTTTHTQKRTPDTMQRLRDDTKTNVPPPSDTDTGTHTATYRTTDGTEARKGPKIHTHTRRGVGYTFTESHLRGPRSRWSTETRCTRTQSLRGGSIDTHRHTQTPPDTHAGTGVGLETLILHKAGPLRGAPRHRGPLLTQPPLSSKSDPPSRLQRGQGTRPPVPSAFTPLRAAAPLREGPGPARPSSRGQPAPAPGPHRPQPRPPREPRLRGDPGAEDAAGPGAAPCAPSAVPGPAVPGLAGAGRSWPRGLGAFRSRVLRPLHPAPPRAVPAGRGLRSRRVPPRQRSPRPAPVGFPPSGDIHAPPDFQSPTRGHHPARAPHSKSCEARFSSIAPPQPYLGTPFPRPNRPLNFPSPGPRPRLPRLSNVPHS